VEEKIDFMNKIVFCILFYIVGLSAQTGKIIYPDSGDVLYVNEPFVLKWECDSAFKRIEPGIVTQVSADGKKWFSLDRVVLADDGVSKTPNIAWSEPYVMNPEIFLAETLIYTYKDVKDTLVLVDQKIQLRVLIYATDISILSSCCISLEKKASKILNPVLSRKTGSVNYMKENYSLSGRKIGLLADSKRIIKLVFNRN
jgi:hypothetical protein